MKIGLDMGHNCPPDTGAVGIKKEDDLTKAVGTRLMKKLSAAGHKVIDCTPSQASSVIDSLRQRVKKANAENVNFFVSIHFNAFKPIPGPRGTEIYAVSNVGKAIARSVLKKIVKLGFIDKGVKRRNFYVLKHTSMPAILIECCFVDSQADMNLFDVEQMAEAIKVGLIDYIRENSEPQPGTLTIAQTTILKPSTDQGEDLAPETLINIDLGEYPVLDFCHEERHYYVKWPDKSQGNRDEHFIFDGHAKIR